MHKNCLFWPLCPTPHTQSLADRKKMFPDTYKNIFLSVCLLRKTNTKKKKQKEAKNNKFNQRIPNILWPDGWHDYFGNNIEGISFVFFVCWLPSLHLLSWPVSRTSRVWFEQINYSRWEKFVINIYSCWVRDWQTEREGNAAARRNGSWARGPFA